MSPASEFSNADPLSEDFLRRHEEQCPFVVIECDKNLCITLWSVSAELKLGWARDEVLGRTIYDAGVLHAEDHAKLHNVLKFETNTNTKTGSRVTLRLQAKSGGHRTFDFGCSVIRMPNCPEDHAENHAENHAEDRPEMRAENEHQCVGQQGVQQQSVEHLALKLWGAEIDALLEEKRAAEAANQLKSHFLANMSHEIRAPLGAILGFADLMAAPETSQEERVEFLRIIERNGRHLGRLIDDILDLTKVEAGKMEVSSEFVHPLSVVNEVIGYVGRKALQNQVRLIVTTSIDVPERIETDLVRFRQVLTNVIQNAVKFTRNGDVKIHLSMTEPSLLKFTVRDSGRGIQEATRQKLFSPFVRETGSWGAQGPPGHGLGLVLARKLARILGGDLVLMNTKVGEGSEFAITISIFGGAAKVNGANSAAAVGATNGSISGSTGSSTGGETQADRPFTMSSEINSSASDLSGYQILVVDDSRDSQTLIERLLCRRGAHVEIARDGFEGVNRVKDHDWDVVLMDIQMPRIDGIEATRQLRAMGYEGVVIALTAHAMKDEKRRCFEAGCTDHLSKPVQAQGLIDRIRSLVPAPLSLC